MIYLCYAVVILYFLFLILSLLVYKRVFKADKKHNCDPKVIESRMKGKVDDKRIGYLVDKILLTRHEEVYITSHDGLTLFGRYYHVKDGAPIDIHFHGYRSLSARDCCGVFRISCELCHNVLLVDERAHGKSDGKVISFGINERYDCLEWAKYCENRFGKDCKITLIGLSMGAATVLMASSLELPENVVGIISDSAYTSPVEIIEKVSRDMKIPPSVVSCLAVAGAKLFGHFDLCESTAEREVKKCKKPVLFIHGENDYFVPSYMTRKIYAACDSKKRISILKNSGHCSGYIFNTERYIKEITDFFDYVLGNSPKINKI